MTFISNIWSSVKYQIQRRVQNPISSLFGIVLAISSMWIYRNLAEIYWPIISGYFWEKRQLLYIAIVFFGTLSFHAVNFFVYHIIDKYNLFYNRKITKTGLLWETDKQKWKNLRTKSIKLNIINIIIIGFISILSDSFFLRDTLMQAKVPSFYQMFSQFFIMMMIQGMLFYIFHKVGHLYLYNLHKVHHEFHVPTLLATTHFHPIDYILGVLVPFAAGPKLLSNKMHIVTFMLWSVFRVSEGHDGHSNYQFPWSPFRAFPLSTTSQYHSFHHTHNQGNFGSTDMVPDTACYDNEPFFKYKNQQKKQKSQKGAKQN